MTMKLSVATPEDLAATTTVTPATVQPTHPRNLQNPTSDADREEVRRRDEERKREYERQVAERTRKEKEDRERVSEEERRRQQHEQYWREVSKNEQLSSDSDRGQRGETLVLNTFHETGGAF